MPPLGIVDTLGMATMCHFIWPYGGTPEICYLGVGPTVTLPTTAVDWPRLGESLGPPEPQQAAPILGQAAYLLLL